MSIKTKKSKVVFKVSAVAVILAGLVVGIPACRTGAEIESLPLPYAVPVADILRSTSTTAPSIENFSYVLEWKRPDGPIYPSYPTDSMDIIDAMLAALDTWEEYVKIVDPLPGYKKEGGDKVTAGVFSGGKLNNSQSQIDAHGAIVIPRYWPIGELDSVTTPSKATWDNIYDKRVEAFQTAVEMIQNMIDTMEGSPLYLATDPRDQTQPLVILHDKMVEFIEYNDTSYTDRTSFDIASNGTEGYVDLSKSGQLYEYYFGFVPHNTIASYTDDTGNFAYDD